MRSDAGAASGTSVVICAYTLDRWADIQLAVQSALAQTPPALELLLVVDHNPELAARARVAWPELHVVESRGPQGLSGARNTGVEDATGELVAFLDDDAQAEPGWLAGLVAPFADPLVVATGGHAEAAWDAGRPRWFPREFDWVVGCSYIGLPARGGRVRNPIGASMAFRRALVLEAGGFRSDVGRVGAHPTGGEETELSIRIRRLRPDARVILAPNSRVRHRVPAARGTFGYFRSRCFQEGRSKARIAVLEGPGAALSSERTYTTRTLPAGVLRGIGEAIRGRPEGLARAGAIVTGLALTTAGYVAGRFEGWRAGRVRPRDRS